MKITQQTPKVLNIHNIASSVTDVLFGSAFLLVGLATYFLFGNLTVLKCNRIETTQIDCEITAVNILGKKTEPIRVKNLQGAKVEGSSDGETYRVVLNTQNSKKIPLTRTYSSGWGTRHHKNASLINSFIQQSEVISFEIKQDERLFVFLFGGIFILVGSCLIYHSIRAKHPTSGLFDKN